MKTLLVLILTVFVFLGCADNRRLGNSQKEYETYGFFNQESRKSPCVLYEASFGNIAWSIVLFETVIAPVYFFGWSVFEPIRMKSTNELKQQGISLDICPERN